MDGWMLSLPPLLLSLSLLDPRSVESPVTILPSPPTHKREGGRETNEVFMRTWAGKNPRVCRGRISLLPMKWWRSFV